VIEAFPGEQSGDGSEFWAPCDSAGPPIGGYGVRLRADTALHTHCRTQVNKNRT